MIGTCGLPPRGSAFCFFLWGTAWGEFSLSEQVAVALASPIPGHIELLRHLIVHRAGIGADGLFGVITSLF